MGLYSDAAAYGAETTAVQAGDLSFGQKAGASVAGALISGLGSIYNTAAAGANILGANWEELSTYNTLQDLDTNWASYYKENASAIDIGGFIVSSLLPGSLAVKALNMARAGASVGAVGRALNFARTKQASALTEGLKELAQEGGSIFTRINKNKLAVMGWETADQTLQAAVFELGVALTMKQSPLLADDSWWDIGKGVATGALLGGGIGGGIMSLGINKAFKDSVKAIDLKSNEYTALSGTKKLGLSQGDEAFGLIDSILKIPTEVLEKDKFLELSFPLGSGPVKKSVDISTVLTNVMKASTRKVMDEFEISLKQIAGGLDSAGKATIHADVADPVAQMVLTRFSEMRKQGLTPSEIRDRMGDTLWGLKKVTAASEDPLYTGADLMYFKKRITPEDTANVKGIVDWESLTISPTPFGPAEQAYKKPYIFLGTPEERSAQKLAIIGSKGESGFSSLDAAWKAGYHIAKEPDGALRVNPKSSLWKQVQDPVYDSRRYLNTRTGAVTEDAVLTVADRLPAGKKLVITETHVSMELAEGGMKKANMLEGFQSSQPSGTLTTRTGKKYKLKIADADKDSVRMDKVSVFDGDKEIGTLEYSKQFDYTGGPVEPVIHVDPAYQRQGIASTLYKIAENRGGKLPSASSKNAVRTPEGQAFRSGSGNSAGTFVVREGSSLDYVTARHAWAGSLADSAIPRVVDAGDVSLLTRISKAPASVRGEILIRGADGTTTSALGIEDILLRSKIDAIQAAFNAGSPDIREVAYRFAAPEDWVQKLIGSEFGSALKNLDELKEGSSRELLDFLKRENVIAQYQKPTQFVDTKAYSVLDKKPTAAEKRDAILAQAGAAGGQFVTGEMAYAYRVQAAIKANKNASAAALGAEFHSQLIELNQDAAKLADSIGAGASFGGAANSNYGELLRQAAEHTGKLVHGKIQQASDDIVSAFASVSAKVLDTPKLAAELGIVTNLLRADPGKFVFMEGLVPGQGKTLIRRELAAAKTPTKFQQMEAEMKLNGERTRIEIENQEVMDFLLVHRDLNSPRVQRNGVLANARGITSNKDPRVIYAPPIDTNYFQHFAFVRPIEGKAFSTSEVSMVFGRNAEELSKRMALVDREQFDVITKEAGERYHKAKGDYDFDQTINERSIDSELRRTGALSNFFPETRGKNIVEDYLRWHQNQESRMIRNAIESNYSQQFQELSALGKSYEELATTKFSGTLRSAKSEIVNPYEDYKKTFLDISKRSEYTFFHQANEFIDSLGTRAYQILSDITGEAQRGLVPWTEANAIAEKHGIKGMYSSSHDYFTSNVPRDRNLIKEAVAKANTLLANLVLRFDFAQSLMNVVSTPLLLSTELASIRSLSSQGAVETGALNELTRVAVPGMPGQSVPSTLKLLFNAVRNFHGPDKDALLQRYKSNGDIKDTMSLYHSAISDLSLSPNFKAFSDGATRAADKIAAITGNNFAEQFTRFVSADVMRQLTEPLVTGGKLSLQEANAYISTFVNRVQGNYISSQRPVVFQGVLGGAIGLFQTYSFNLLQQLLRHVENKDRRAVATLFGMQSGLFGLNGTPMFDAINTHIIGNAAINQGHYDAYSIAPQLLGQGVGNWLMYGTVSAFPAFSDKWPALYTRGDINPRHMTILPMTPADIPAFDASIRTVKNIVDTGKKLMGGADISETLLQGLEHNGINRPLAGFAQLLSGQSTTSKGNLISANSDYELIASASRIAGAKPMDEAIALNNMYRLKAYDAADSDRMEALGETVKTHLKAGKMPSDEDFMRFMGDYAKIGGRLEKFSSKMQTWAKDANVSVTEKMRTNIHSQTGQRLSEIMGGPLPDWQNQQSSETATPAAAALEAPTE